ncbi:hypothetical protein CLAIMM_09706 [Cladophialophora immunda]|nr:hypothetical protein CLAIMM_09706 [Cladophialophora immunda]
MYTSYEEQHIPHHRRLSTGNIRCLMQTTPIRFEKAYSLSGSCLPEPIAPASSGRASCLRPSPLKHPFPRSCSAEWASAILDLLTRSNVCNAEGWVAGHQEGVGQDGLTVVDGRALWHRVRVFVGSAPKIKRLFACRGIRSVCGQTTPESLFVKDVLKSKKISGWTETGRN